MNAKEFIEAWMEFVGREILKPGETWSDVWTERGASPWTHRVIGKPNRENKSPLGTFIGDRLKEDTLRFRLEEWKVDLVLARTKSRWKDGHDGKWIENRINKTGYLFWPSTYEILIEHENYCTTSWEEMAKLIHLRAKLKVLITYTEDINKEKHREYSDDLVKQTQCQLRSMLKQASQDYPENKKTEYVLIIGQLDKTGKTPMANWHFSTYNAKGVRTSFKMWPWPPE